MASLSFPGILYSCNEAAHRVGEQFVPEHVLSFVVAGEMHFYTPQVAQVFEAGSLVLVHRHQLVKTTKVPPAGGQFKALSVVLDQAALRGYADRHQRAATAPYRGPMLRPLSHDPFIAGFFSSLLPYFDQPAPLSPALIELKGQEAVGLLLRADPELRH